MPAPLRLLIASTANNERARLQAELQGCTDLQVVALSGDIFSALEAIRAVEPDVMLLDLDMPGGGSIALLHKVMKSHPIPVIALFADGGDGQVAAAQALAVGAADTQAKRGGRCSMADMVEELSVRILRVGQVKACSPVAPRKVTSSNPQADASNRPQGASLPPRKRAAMASNRLDARGALQSGPMKAIVIGASTGGTHALHRVLAPLPGNLPGIAIVQHMPADFTGRLAERLNRRSEVTVVEAEDGMLFLPGHAYIAPGGRHLALTTVGSECRIALSDGPLIGGHKPAVEHLFQSVATLDELEVMAIILTGMGGDGCTGMKRLHDQGALTVAQDEATCAVFGMPREAILAGGVSHIQALDDIPQRIVAFGSERSCSKGAA